MLKPSEQESKAVLSALAPILPGVYQNLERAVTRADGFFETDYSGLARSPWLHAGLTRFHFNANIGGVLPGLVVAEDAVLAEWQPNDGIRLRYKEFRVRVLKALTGGLPPAGSCARAREFEQLHLLGLPAVRLEVVLHWSVGAKGLELVLARPESPANWPDNSTVVWQEPIPHDMVIAAPAAASVPDTGTADADDDLPIRRATPDRGAADPPE